MIRKTVATKDDIRRIRTRLQDLVVITHRIRKKPAGHEKRCGIPAP